MLYRFLLLIILGIGFSVYSCASLSGAGEVRYSEDVEDVREASANALQRIGMEIHDIRDGVTSDYIIVGERQNASARVDSETAGTPELVRLEVEIRALDDGSVSVDASTPTAANYASTSGTDLIEQFYSSLEEYGLEPVDDE